MHTNYLPSHPQAWSPQTAMDLLHFQEEDIKEHMFEKPLTPSDVGKLNRLVIPKQFAEKYFPLAGESGEKGLLLNFEDEAGKPWRFRYSYWTSSQSYVLTKGWSRFVKDKQLDAGDVVLFQRRRGDHLLYIGCRRRGDSQISHVASRASAPPQSWSPLFFDSTSSSSPPGFFLHEGRQSMGGAGENAAATKPLASKRLRLFGVNLDCVP